MIGKTIRMSQFINPITHKCCIIPLDHGVTVGPIDGMNNLAQSINDIVTEKVDAIVIHKGIFSKVSKEPEILTKTKFLLHISASTALSQEANHKRIVSSVERAVKYGAIGVSIHINLGNNNEGEMLADFGRVSEACIDWGMPLLAMMYVREGANDSVNVSEIAHAARVAEEMGADIVKVNCPRNVEDIGLITHSVSIPVLISGGEKMESNQMLWRVYKAMQLGVSGVSIGRNVFQSENPRAMINLMSDIVHGKVENFEVELALSKII